MSSTRLFAFEHDVFSFDFHFISGLVIDFRVHEENFWTRNNLARCNVKFCAVFGTGYGWPTIKIPAPVTKILDQRTQQAIQNTFTPLEKTIQNKERLRGLKHRLLTLANNTDLFKPDNVTDYILTLKKKQRNPKTHQWEATTTPATNGYKRNLCQIYVTFCKYNLIPYDSPKIRCHPPIPIIPSTANVSKIIHNASRKFIAIFTILAETAVEGQELSNVHQNQIDAVRGSISVTGVKGHTNGIYPLRAQTAEMLRQYLAKHQNEPYPFPPSRHITNAWIYARKKAAKKLCQPDLMKIPLKNLRNYAGAMFYYGKGNKDPWAVMKFMRHKQLSTTQDYLRSMATPEEDSYTHRTIQLGTPTTIKEIEEAIDTGFKLATQADGYQLFVKLKPLEI
jgi:integrase